MRIRYTRVSHAFESHAFDVQEKRTRCDLLHGFAARLAFGSIRD